MAVSRQVYQRRMGGVVLSGVACLIVGLAGRLVFINTQLRPQLIERAGQQWEGRTILPARRGAILDSSHRIVATSRHMPDVFVDAAHVSDMESLAKELAVRLNVSPEEILKKLKARADSRYVVVGTKVDEVTAEAIMSMHNPVIGLTDCEVRTYPLGSSMAHVLGFVGKDNHGLEGIELAFDKYLAGRHGERATVHDARRRAMFRSGENESVDPVDGGHVVLTIDAEVQRLTEQAIERAVQDFEAESAIGIVMCPQNGEVLAMACWPAYESQEGNSAPPALRRNRAITDPVEPGSTFKPFIASGALAAKVLSPTEKIDCKMGTHFFGSRRVHDEHPYGLLELRLIIAKSSNIGMTFIAERMGYKRLRDSIRAFGFGERTGIELPGEDAGIVHPLSMWRSSSIPSVAQGYEVGVTPIQLASAFSAMVNNGVRVQPRIVKELLGPDGEVVQCFDEPKVLGQAIAPDIARFMAQDLMASVVEEGTATRAKLEDYRVVGKTGTAKLVRRDGKPGYEDGQYLSVFMGAAPLEKPEVLALVMVRRPNAKHGYYGGVVSAPAVAEILRQALPYMGVPPDQGPELAEASSKRVHSN